MSQSREPDPLQLNLLLSVEEPSTDLPQDCEDELSIALARLLLSAAGLEVQDDEPKVDA